jgi:signal transduction histidine kinase
VEDQRRTQRESQFLAEVSTVLAGSLDYEETLSRAARLVVPTLADVCMVDLVERDGTLKRVAVANVVEPQSFAQKARSFPLSLVTGNPLYPPIQALREGRSVHVEHVDEAWIRRVALNAEHAAYLESVAPSSVIAVPLVARGRVFGVITVSSYAGGRRLTAADLRVTEELAHRAALSVDNARLYREAQDAIHIRDEFLTVASHELKTPLTPLTLKIDSFARTLQATSGAKEWEAYARDVEVMRRQVRRLTVLVNDLLDVSRIAAGRMRLELEQVDLVPLVREVTQRFESEAARAGCALEVWAEGPVTGRWDRLRLEQILANLLSNALKYGAGKPIHVRVEREGDRARLVVRDQGIGIAPDAQARIFGKFERAVSERNYGGLGLGLHVTRTLVEAMGGTVWVESALGQGATFTVELPLSGPA